MCLIADAVQPVYTKAGEVIINEGEQGDCFYMVMEGECSVSKPLSGFPNEIATIKKGGYFGERALILNEPRAATITSKTDCQLARLDRRAFTRLLGPLIDELRNGIEHYSNSQPT